VKPEQIFIAEDAGNLEPGPASAINQGN